MRDGDVLELHIGDAIQSRREARLRCGFRPHLDADAMRAGFRYGDESQIIDQVSQKIEVRERAAQKAAQSRRPGVPTATMVIHNDSLHDGSPRISGWSLLVSSFPSSDAFANFGVKRHQQPYRSCFFREPVVRDSVVRLVCARFRFSMLSS